MRYHGSMSANRESNECTPSTAWEWRRVKIRRPAGGQDGSAPKALRWFRLPPRNGRIPITISVKYRGGGECWYEIHARGQVGRFPGYVAIHDIMREINQSDG